MNHKRLQYLPTYALPSLRPLLYTMLSLDTSPSFKDTPSHSVSITVERKNSPDTRLKPIHKTSPTDQCHIIRLRDHPSIPLL